MRPLFVLLFAVTVFAVPVVAAPVPKGLKKTEPPSVNGRWKMTGYNGNGKLLPPDRNPDWVIDDEKVIIGNDTKPLTFQDPDRPDLRKFDGLPLS